MQVQILPRQFFERANMNAQLITIPNPSKPNGGYISIHDDGYQAKRTLIITDDDGNMVKIRNDQIGQLYKQIKPALEG